MTFAAFGTFTSVMLGGSAALFIDPGENCLWFYLLLYKMDDI
jgi:hypothetical protein